MVEDPKFCPHCGAARVGEMRFCVSCGKQIVSDAAPASAPQVAPPRKKLHPLVVIMLLIVVAGACVLFSVRGGRGNGLTVTDGQIGAFIMCKQFVTDRLKSPSSAVFPTAAGDGVSIATLSSAQYRVHAYVDSQNSFGATIRTTYDCTVRNTAGQNWVLENLVTTP